MRDIDDLTLSGLPLYCVKGKNGGIYLMDSVKLNKPPMSKSELMSIETSLKAGYKYLMITPNSYINNFTKYFDELRNLYSE